MNLLRRSSDPSEMVTPVPLDLSGRDDPSLAVQRGPKATARDLMAQRRRRQPELGCRLSEREHLLRDAVAAPLADASSARLTRLGAGLLRGFHLVAQFLRQCVHRVSLRCGGVHMRILAPIGHVCQGVIA